LLSNIFNTHFVASDAYANVGSYRGDGLYRNIGDACPAGSRKPTNVPDDNTGGVCTALRIGK